LLEVHAPWCEACAAVHDAVTELAVQWRDERRLRVGSIDVSRNDLPRSLAVQSLPALLFFRADRKPDAPPIDLSHLRSTAEMSSAVLQHASTQLSRPLNPAELGRLLELLPALQTHAQQLLEENDRLRDEVMALRAKLP